MSNTWQPVFLSPTDQRWTQFITLQEQAILFHHPAWINLIAESYSYTPFILAIVNKQGDIDAGVPLMKVKGVLNKKRWVSLPFSDHCAPLYKSDEAVNYLTASLIDISREERINNIELRSTYPAHPKIQPYANFVSTRLSLISGEQRIANRIQAKHFRQIKVSYQRGVRIEWGIDQKHLDTFYDLHVRNRRRLGIPVQPLSFFKRLGDLVLRRGYGFLLLAYKEKVCVSAAIFLYWNRTLIYKYSASTAGGRHLLAMDPILWTAICWGCGNHFSWLDMGRTNLAEQGLRKFKRRWGAEESPLIYSVSPPQPPPSLQRKPMRLIQSVIKKSPLCVCRLAGQVYYRYFG